MNRLRRILLLRTNPWRPYYTAAPPLGCMMLASAVRKWFDPRIDIKLIDMCAEGKSSADVADVLLEFDPDLIGFSTLSLEHVDLIDLLDKCRAWNPERPIVVGGPHATMFGDLLVEDPRLDFIVRGEGEHTFVELLQVLRDGGDLRSVKGLLFKQDGETVDTGARPFESDLDRLPFPAWDLIDLRAFHTRATNMNGYLAATPYMPVMSSRACPYRCVYCHRIFGTRFRQRSVDNFLQELHLLRDRHGVREIHIFDDCFNLNRSRAIEICEKMVSSGLDLKMCFPNGVRGDLMDEELVRAFKAAGAYMITYAVESVNERIQKLIQKNLDLEKTVAAIEATDRLGVVPAGFFVLGFPSETPEEIENTVRFACESPILKAYFFTAVAFGRTELFELVKSCYPDLQLEEADILGNASYYSPVPFYAAATGVDLRAIQRRAYRRFYFDPRRVARILQLLPWNRHILRGAFLGFQASFDLVRRMNSVRSRSAAR